MEGGRSSPAAIPLPNFSVYQNPTFSAALTSASLHPSAATLFLISSTFLASAVVLFTMLYWKVSLVEKLVGFGDFYGSAFMDFKILQAAISLIFIASLSAFIKVLSMLNSRKTLIASYSKKYTENVKILTDRQLRLLGLKNKLTESYDKSNSAEKTPMSKPNSEPLVPIRKSPFGHSPRSVQRRFDQQSSSSGKKSAISPQSSSSTPYKYASSSAIPWSKQSPGSANGILTEEKLEDFLADVDEKILESEANAVSSPSITIDRLRIENQDYIMSSASVLPLRPVRMSPSLLQKYSPKKNGVGELPLPMTMEQTTEAFEHLGIYPQIEQWRDSLRQWFSSVVINPLLDKIETSHNLVIQTAANLGMNISISQIGCELNDTTMPVHMSPLYGLNEWHPNATLDEDVFLHQMHTSLVQARNGTMSSGQQAQQIALLPLIQHCVDAIAYHLRLKSLLKGELIKGLLPQSSVPADFIAYRVRELAEGSCLKNFDHFATGTNFDRSGKKWKADVPSDSHLLLYLFCAFLEHPNWALHIETLYSSVESAKSPLFLGVLPPKDQFPEKYVAVISGVPSVIHSGACVLSIGKQLPPIFSLYWDNKLQLCFQGRTALWDAILLLCHRIKVSYNGIVRGVHLGSSNFNILSILDSETDS